MIIRNVDNRWVVCNYNYLMIVPDGVGKDENSVKNFIHNYLAKTKDNFVSNQDTKNISRDTMPKDFVENSYSKLFGFIDMITIGSVLDTVKVALWSGNLREHVMLKNSRYIENVIVYVDEDDMVNVELPEGEDSSERYTIMNMNLDYLELFGKPEISNMIENVTKSVRDECHEKARNIRNYAGYKDFANYLTDCDVTLLSDEGFGDLLR